ncbi:alpha/beta hydrolase-fold protein [Pseudoalteromonas fenneropenaei]|uniref:Alpha/beta hydrolase-fold protein n=1 Tax=Pseudoalteromonas fenneropenaei TaxID=1737459 RepID=A0ABV7CIS6_9GAMM
MQLRYLLPMRLLLSTGLCVLTAVAWANNTAEAIKLRQDVFQSTISLADLKVVHHDFIRATHFNELFALLSQGPHFATNNSLPRFIKQSYKSKQNVRFRYSIRLPHDYQPSKTYPLLVFLHGGIDRPAWQNSQQWWIDLPNEFADQAIILYPSAWRDKPWWHFAQLENIRELLKLVKQSYAVDTNKIYLSGISDGGSGSYYLASHLADQFAAVGPFIGSPTVLAAPRNQMQGNVFELNLANLPWLIINGEQDKLYPAEQVGKFIDYLQQFGDGFEFAAVPGGHSLHTVRENWQQMAEFLKSQQRPPLSQDVKLQVESNSLYNRHSWLIVNFSGATHLANIPNGLKRDSAPSVIVYAKQTDNHVTLQASQATEVILLLSPSLFDFTKPITVTENGKTLFSKQLEPSKATLLKWAKSDLDPNRLYAAELEIQLSGNSIQ